MILDQTIDRQVSDNLVKKNILEREEHVSSGKLTAGMLGWAKLNQVLKIIGVPIKDPDPYVLRKFVRGNHVEDWITGQMPGLVATQKKVEYQHCVGVIDALVNTIDYEFPLGVIPHEVKSVTNAKFKRLEKLTSADRSHRLQATLYALAEGAESYAIDYVASDDYRILSFIYKTADTAGAVRKITEECYAQLASHNLPVFDPPEPWMANPDYNNYAEWMNLTEDQLMAKLMEEYPESYKKLTEWSAYEE